MSGWQFARMSVDLCEGSGVDPGYFATDASQRRTARVARQDMAGLGGPMVSRPRRYMAPPGPQAAC